MGTHFCDSLWSPSSLLGVLCLWRSSHLLFQAVWIDFGKWRLSHLEGLGESRTHCDPRSGVQGNKVMWWHWVRERGRVMVVISLVQAADIYSFNNWVVLDECCRESTKAAVAVRVLSSTPRSKEQDRWWWVESVVYTHTTVGVSYRRLCSGRGQSQTHRCLGCQGRQEGPGPTVSIPAAARVPGCLHVLPWPLSIPRLCIQQGRCSSDRNQAGSGQVHSWRSQPQVHTQWQST